MLILRYLLVLLGLVFLQVFLLNELAFAGFMNPYVYILFVLLLPISAPRLIQLIAAFLIGWFIDIFENSGGVHIAATVLLAYIRPIILQLSIKRNELEQENLRLISAQISSFLIYALIGIFIHHLVLFSLEAFAFSNYGQVILRTLYSTGFTFIFVLIIRLWNFRTRTD